MSQWAQFIADNIYVLIFEIVISIMVVASLCLQYMMAIEHGFFYVLPVTFLFLPITYVHFAHFYIRLQKSLTDMSTSGESVPDPSVQHTHPYNTRSKTRANKIQ